MLKLCPVLDVHDGKQNADQGGNTFLDEQVGLLDVLRQKQVPELALFGGVEVFVQVYEVSFEKDGGHLSVSELVGVDEDVAEHSDGAFMFGVGL